MLVDKIELVDTLESKFTYTVKLDKKEINFNRHNIKFVTEKFLESYQEWRNGEFCGYNYVLKKINISADKIIDIINTFLANDKYFKTTLEDYYIEPSDNIKFSSYILKVDRFPIYEMIPTKDSISYYNVSYPTCYLIGYIKINN